MAVNTCDPFDKHCYAVIYKSVRERATERAQDQRGAQTVVEIGGIDPHCERQIESVHQRMAIVSARLIAAVAIPALMMMPCSHASRVIGGP